MGSHFDSAKKRFGLAAQIRGGSEPRIARRRAERALEGRHQAPRAVHDGLRTPSQPLDSQTREYFEPRFGYDFSQVRVHADSKAAESARAVGAEAFTVANHIVVGKAQLSPSTRAGRTLLAHELVHVLQQGEGAVPEQLMVGDPASELELQAAAVARRIDGVEPTGDLRLHRASAPVLCQRQEAPPPAENEASIRQQIVASALRQVGQHYLWGAEGETPGLGDVVMHTSLQGVAKRGDCVCAGRHGEPDVQALPKMTETALAVESYSATHSFLRFEQEEPCGGGCGAQVDEEIWGESCIGRRHFDCSGLVDWAYHEAGYDVGRQSVAGYQGADSDVAGDALEPGDLCYRGNHHVGIYAGGDEVVHAENHAHGVRVTPLDATWDSFGTLFRPDQQ